MTFDPNLEDRLNGFFPDPRSTPHDEALSELIRSELSFLPNNFFVWADENGNTFLECPGPLSDELKTSIEKAGYKVFSPTIGLGRIQNRLMKVTA